MSRRPHLGENVGHPTSRGRTVGRAGRLTLSGSSDRRRGTGRRRAAAIRRPPRTMPATARGRASIRRGEPPAPSRAAGAQPRDRALTLDTGGASIHRHRAERRAPSSATAGLALQRTSDQRRRQHRSAAIARPATSIRRHAAEQPTRGRPARHAQAIKTPLESTRQYCTAPRGGGAARPRRRASRSAKPARRMRRCYLRPHGRHEHVGHGGGPLDGHRRTCRWTPSRHGTANITPHVAGRHLDARVPRDRRHPTPATCSTATTASAVRGTPDTGRWRSAWRSCSRRPRSTTSTPQRLLELRVREWRARRPRVDARAGAEQARDQRAVAGDGARPRGDGADMRSPSGFQAPITWLLVAALHRAVALVGQRPHARRRPPHVARCRARRLTPARRRGDRGGRAAGLLPRPAPSMFAMTLGMRVHVRSHMLARAVAQPIGTANEPPSGRLAPSAPEIRNDHSPPSGAPGR